MRICISNRRDRNSMERISSLCRVLKKDRKPPVWCHLAIKLSPINPWDTRNQRRLQTNSKTSTEFSSQVEIGDRVITWGTHRKTSSTGMTVIGEIITGLTIITRRRARATERKKNTTVTNTVDHTTRPIRECRAVRSEEPIPDSHSISRGEDEQLNQHLALNYYKLLHRFEK